MRSFGTGMLLISTAAACGASKADETPRLPDPVLVAAAPETKSELGIERWGVSSDAKTGDTFVHGYDADGTRVVELVHHLVDQDATHGAIEISLTGSHGEARMTIDLVANPTGDPNADVPVNMTIGSNNFPQSPEAQKVVDRMNADTGNGVPETTQAPTGLLGPQTLHPLDGEELYGSPECATLTVECQGSLLSAGVSAAGNSNACAKLLTSTGVVLICRAIGQVGGGAIAGAFGAGAGLGVGSVPGAIVGVAAGQLLGGMFMGQLCTILTGAKKQAVDCVNATFTALQDQAGKDACAKACPN
jgi:hypothetical protein